MTTQYEESNIQQFLTELKKFNYHIGELIGFTAADDNSCIVSLDNGTLWLTAAELAQPASILKDNDLLDRIAHRFRARRISTAWRPMEYEIKQRGFSSNNPLRSFFAITLILVLLGAGYELSHDIQAYKKSVSLQAQQVSN